MQDLPPPVAISVGSPHTYMQRVFTVGPDSAADPGSEGVTAMGWPTASAVDAAAGTGWPGLWSVLFTTERAVLALVQATAFAEALDLIWLAEEIGDARADVREGHSLEVLDARAADLGPVLPEDGVEDARRTTAQLLSSAIRRTDELATVTVDASSLLWLAGLGASLFAARTKLVAAAVR